MTMEETSMSASTRQTIRFRVRRSESLGMAERMDHEVSVG
jgi:hypothetical protein